MRLMVRLASAVIPDGLQTRRSPSLQTDPGTIQPSVLKHGSRLSRHKHVFDVL
jgi:hypothetical protein